MKNKKENKLEYQIHLLDELIENIYIWVKRIPLSDTKESWQIHSPNVMMVRKYHLFDKFEYRRGLVNFNLLLDQGILEERSYCHSK